MTSTARTRNGRPTSAQAAEIEEQLRHAALQTFLDHGYDATTMEAVAKATGITKRTLYARYPNKRALFISVIRWAQAQFAWDDPLPDIDTDDLEAGLMSIARSAMTRATDPYVIRLNRMATAEAERFPEVVDFARSLGSSPRVEVVKDLLRVHAERGTVVVDDIELAAEQFIAIVAVLPSRLAAIGAARPPEEQQRYLRHAVELFLRGVLTRPRDVAD